MPSAAAITRSSGALMKPRTRSGLAPTYDVVTLIVAFSLRGYCRTLRERTACRPAIRITRLTTIARTGLRMKRSVNFMTQPFSVVSRLRIDRGLGSELVVDHERSAVAQLERTGGD